MDNMSIPELISSLQTTFLVDSFANVESALVAREQRMKSDNQGLKEQLDLEQLHNISLQHELNQCKGQVSALREENSKFRETLKSAEDARAKAEAEEVKRVRENDEKMIALVNRNRELELKSAEDAKAKAEAEEVKNRNRKLEFAKDKAEAELEILRKTIEELTARLSSLENPRVRISKQGEIKEEPKEGVSKRDNNVDAKQAAGPTCSSGSLQRRGSERRPYPNTVEIIDSDDDDSTPVVLMSEKGMNMQLPLDNANLEQAGAGNRRDILKRKGASCLSLSENDNNDVEDIGDSTCSGKFKMIKRSVSTINHSSAIVVSSDNNDDGKLFPESSSRQGLLNPVEERMKSECKSHNLRSGFPLGFLTSAGTEESSDSDNDKLRMQFKCSQHGRVSQEKDVSPINHSSAIVVSSDYNDAGKLFPKSSSRQGLLDPVEERMESACKSHNLRSGFPLGLLTSSGTEESSDSSDSESDSDDDILQMQFNCSHHGRVSQENDGKWKRLSNMIIALEKDNELCMNAICALYRQPKLRKQSLSSSLSSVSWGFHKSDELRGVALAKFLTDGDPEGELKRSVKELEEYEPGGLDVCRELAILHSEQLLEIYENNEDTLFSSL